MRLFSSKTVLSAGAGFALVAATALQCAPGAAASGSPVPAPRPAVITALPAPRPSSAPPTEQLRPATATAATRVPVTQLHVVSYTPSDNPWSKMWDNYSHTRSNSDFAAIHSLGANAVRIAISPYNVGWPTVSTAGAAKIHDVIETAQANGLSVQLTLFDWSNPFAEVTKSQQWLRSALASYANDPEISLVEIKNEIDVTNPTVLNWTREMLATLPSVLPGVPRTVSVGGSQDLTSMRALTTAIPSSLLDVIDIHLYGTQSVVAEKLNNAMAVASGRTVFVGEFGQATTAATSCSYTSQAAFFNRIRLLLADKGITGFGVWMLSDINPAAAPPSYQNTDQIHYGLRGASGTWKPSVTVLRAMFAQDGTAATARAAVTSSHAAYQYVDGGFDCTAATIPSSSTGSAYDNWVVFAAPAVHSSGVIAGQGVNGSPAAALGGTSTSNGSMPSVMRRFPVLDSSPVSASAQIRLLHGTGTTTIGIAWFAGTRYLGNKVAVAAATTSSAWQTRSVTATPPAGADSFQVHLMSGSNSGTAYFDNVIVS